LRRGKKVEKRDNRRNNFWNPSCNEGESKLAHQYNVQLELRDFELNYICQYPISEKKVGEAS
jgi:hypothetical protein